MAEIQVEISSIIGEIDSDLRQPFAAGRGNVFRQKQEGHLEAVANIRLL
jgi:hypothetical protein